MARKKKSSLGSLICGVVVIALIVVCVLYIANTRVFGSYKSEASVMGIGGSVTYTFSGINTVTEQTEVTIIGKSTTSRTGSYSIKDNTITFKFKEKNDNGETTTKENTYEFYKGKDTLKIAGVEYKKVK